MADVAQVEGGANAVGQELRRLGAVRGVAADAGEPLPGPGRIAVFLRGMRHVVDESLDDVHLQPLLGMAGRAEAPGLSAGPGRIVARMRIVAERAVPGLDRSVLELPLQHAAVTVPADLRNAQSCLDGLPRVELPRLLALACGELDPHDRAG